MKKCKREPNMVEKEQPKWELCLLTNISHPESYQSGAMDSSFEIITSNQYCLTNGVMKDLQILSYNESIYQSL